MSDLLKNILFLVFALVIAGLGYYLYSNQGLDFIRVSENQQAVENLEQETARFISRLRVLREIDFQLELFDDPRFTELESFATPVLESEVGRPNPFLRVGEN